MDDDERRGGTGPIMSERATAWRYALPLGVLGGLFALVQVLVSVLAALANSTALRTMHQILVGFQQGSPSDPTVLAGDLTRMVLVTYTASLVTGFICLGFCWYAGRLTAFVLGWHAAGALAGFLVMLISSTSWIAASVAATLIARADGTLSGVFTSAFAGGDLTVELIALLAQELLAVLVGFGLAAIAGKLGEVSAPISPPRPAPQAAPPRDAAPPGVLPAAPAWPAYPPPPSYFSPPWQDPTGDRPAPPAPDGAHSL
jgi:hypothetical protein